MRLEEINALREFDRQELIAKARELGIKVPEQSVGRHFPTSDALRLEIIAKTIEGEVEPTISKVGADHLAEAISVHAHAVELGRRAEKMRDDGHYPDGAVDREAARAVAHFETARSAAAIAQAALTAAALGVVGDVAKELS